MMPTLTRLITPPKGKAPAAWDTTILSDQVAPKRPPVISREAELLRRLSLQQWITLVVVGGMLVVGANQWRLAGKIQVPYVPHVITVAENGAIRSVEILPQQGYVVKEPTMIFVIKHWLVNVRTVGDSRVLLGRAWNEAMVFVAPELRPWFLTEIQERNTLSLEGKKVEMSTPIVIPIGEAERTFKAEWDEWTISQAGDLGPKIRWEATLTLRVAPTATLQERKSWANGLGILLTEVHWHTFSATKGPFS